MKRAWLSGENPRARVLNVADAPAGDALENLPESNWGDTRERTRGAMKLR